MLIQNLFERDIFRPINGVVKADQLDESSVWQELDEFVITRELDGHFRKFIDWYLQAVDQGKSTDPTGKMGIWISGFFGSGKSHFLKVLSYLLRNRTHTHNGQSRQAVDFFESKVPDAMLFADIKKAVASQTDVILFNIDSKADHGTGKGRDLILRVFLRVLNELQGYSGDHPHIAHLERYLDGKGKLKSFQEAYARHTGLNWLQERDAYQFNRDEVVKALSETLGQSQAAAEKWIDGAEDSFSLSVENFCKWVKEYLDSKGPQHRIVFLVDEVGQFIGTDSHLMLNLQTITEELGTMCRRRAWVVVTSQEDMDTVLGDMSKQKKQDFSKIQGRFFPPLSLSSANVDEVIQSRLLAKRADVRPELEIVFQKQGDVLKHQLLFKDCGMTFRQFKDGEDFAKNYPFAPYQFQLVQKIFEAIRKAGATGMHLARGERSMLDAFQSAAKTASVGEVGLLVPLYDFYPSIESFLDTSVKKTIDQAGENVSLEPFDVRLLQALFLIRYVDEMKGNVDNLVTLCMNQIDGDRVSLRRQIEASVARLESETLISRNGDLYFFLTNEERDINKEIKEVDLVAGEESRRLGQLIFNDVLKEHKKHRFSANKMDFEFNRRCDQFPIGNQKENALLVSVISPLADDYELYDKSRGLLESSADGGHVLIRLGNDKTLGAELRIYLQTERYLSRKDDGTLAESTKKILRDCADDNRQRRERLIALLSDMLPAAEYFVTGQLLKIKSVNPMGALEEAMEYLIQNTFTKMGLLKRLSSEPLKEIQAVLRSNDVAKEQLLFQKGENNPEALEDLRSYLQLCAMKSQQVVLHDMLEKRYSVRPYGWPEEEVLLLLARLVVLSEVNLLMDSVLLPVDKVYDAITTPSKRRKVIVKRRETSDPKAIQNARLLGKDLFADMGPDGEDGLMAFLQTRLREWQTALHGFKQLADTGQYPGQTEITDGLTLIAPLLNDKESRKFIERFNRLKQDLLDLADHFRDLQHFYTHQKPTWEKLRKSYGEFQLNRLELEKDDQAGPALRRMREILEAASPYGLIKEAEGLITTAEAVNSSLLTERRAAAIRQIDALITQLTKDLVEAAQNLAELREACLKPLETLRARVEREASLAHITQAETEAVSVFNAGVARIEEFVRKQAEQKPAGGNGKDSTTSKPPPVKKQRIIKPADLVQAAYLETAEDVSGFLDKLRQQLEQAIAANERIQIR
ncbi:BREX system P-loop protein BrxC [Planctellipticum variicoloris]|uniref:BREX system P-loop protein BrxC n=1 Tax=Planctellipticum variicoloris TaxID=3064265 RepID=UPI003013E12E|nr:BREX system P-loop protein BrxC [Planctomycetaceae bacterium SH412]